MPKVKKQRNLTEAVFVPVWCILWSVGIIWLLYAIYYKSLDLSALPHLLTVLTITWLSVSGIRRLVN